MSHGISHEFDPLELIDPVRYGELGRPHSIWAELRRESPVHRVEAPGYPPFYAITRHADILEISGKPNIFSNREGPMFFSHAEREENEFALKNLRTIIQMDPPDHVIYRKVTSGMFTPRSISRLDQIVTECARAHVDQLGPEGEIDFVEAIAVRHPLRVLGTILGLEPEDEELLLKLTQEQFGSNDPELQREGEDRAAAQQQMMLDFFNLFNRIIEDRRINPRDDLATKLATAKLPNGEPLGQMEMLGYFQIVFTAGHDTTRNAISDGMLALIEHPDQLRKLHDDPKLAKSAFEEIVRWSSPVNYMRRHVLEDVELHGVKLRKGDDLVMYYCSANRDENVFDDPFRFDIERRANRHLGFGTGQHFCLGAHVARLSARALFTELAARVEAMEVIAPPTHTAASFVVGLKSLPVRYRMRAGA